jgi:hypothetical protein
LSYTQNHKGINITELKDTTKFIQREVFRENKQQTARKRAVLYHRIKQKPRRNKSARFGAD